MKGAEAPAGSQCRGFCLATTDPLTVAKLRLWSKRLDESSRRSSLSNAHRLWLPENLCGFPILVALCGFYGNSRHNQCKSNEADCHRMMAAPPLMHRKGHAGSCDQQRHQDDHGFWRCRFNSFRKGAPNAKFAFLIRLVGRSPGSRALDTRRIQEVGWHVITPVSQPKLMTTV
jgi:hypothetical protein